MNMFCPNCGAKNEEDSRFCYACGTPLLKEEHVQKDPAKESTENHNAGQEKGPQEEPYRQIPQPENNRQMPPPPYNNYSYGGPGTNPPYGNPMRREKPVKTRKPISKGIWVIAAEILAAAVLVFGITQILADRFSPQTAAESYWKAVAENKWSEAYEYCEFPDSEMLTEQMYVNANAGNSETLSYKSYQIVDLSKSAEETIEQLGQLSSVLGDLADASQELSGEHSDNIREYAVEYLTKGSSDKQYMYLTVGKTGKKQFLFWDEWKVTSSESWCSNIQFQIPENAVLRLNGVVPEAENEVTDGWKYITIPYLFTGTYQMEVTEDGMEPYRKIIHVSSYGCDDTYATLVPSQETLGVVAGQIGSDIQKIIEGGLYGKTFSEIQSLFSQNALQEGYVQDDYEELLRMKDNGEDSGIVTLKVDNIVSSISDISYDRIAFETSMHIKEKYRRSWTSELGDEDYQTTCYVVYEKDGDSWKLAQMPVDYYDF